MKVKKINVKNIIEGMVIEDGEVKIVYDNWIEDSSDFNVFVEKGKENVYFGEFYNVKEGDEDYKWWMKDEENKKGDFEVIVDKENKKVFVDGKEYVINMDIDCEEISRNEWNKVIDYVSERWGEILKV